jgi:hypothetical protein
MRKSPRPFGPNQGISSAGLLVAIGGGDRVNLKNLLGPSTVIIGRREKP